ncbi:15-hydroxyprostaglandin dehydrogenase [NAD(+)]-like isoform X1 [Acanthaster planci]|uniref:15-hydroxyprostaglandin dehydrogenase [NAD(+)] n=1 Tax=Acanthaster planci TaxID=133434 RepID=A0A8B7YA56_ACAPL|nr:15-hydroxyprostaglandin dehydrogenase [NAD(+)]-like isoform X1 [Acanthaster planci]XP_022090125.1 15-hydroxyprostaglandin dehydrogenase [NAD(+)]-like isoform X1 [Acanthaster planci]XP_022090126.1 15-hydroxyprostaglandin dehydrogenase [NAD(+)]-like isoform X1 [Acanthaster planci]XP_022090127.1 15-hydroxyprostaglandin dehydrogenase [NAD(+)]-like isoform X1 [Acanthaster planci]XP_022090128.1 15-hydroxyprostaglandin dehydrogenase [NAD(+)]-like isoform X1 [Acanthaster planci]
MSSVPGENFQLSEAQLGPGTVAIVTGAAEGLGKGFVECLLKKGAKGVCLVDINDRKGEETLRELTAKFGEDRVMFVKGDVTSDSDVEAAFSKTIEKFGHVNVMVNNAGLVNERQPEICYSVNTVGSTRGTYTAIKYMNPANGGNGGKIINIASEAGLMPISHIPVYCASKLAVVGFTKSLAADPQFAEQGITFGVLCPGLANTHILEKALYRDQESGVKQARELKATFGVMEISEVQDAFLRLLLDDSWSGKAMLATKREGIKSV